ncbi:MAG: DUF1385 domain-containing protein, partial [Candidatus Peregrinibacteria bacterium]|nr:DUF1385 domain-containing protein [Candidatus Peregrinibacteria bacterium]
MSKPEEKINFAVGGQAIIEGVMMRSPHYYVVSVRRANGEIIVKRNLYISLTKRSKLWALPLFRGIAVLYESLKLGMRSLMFSNSIMMEDLDAKDARKSKKKTEAVKKEEGKPEPMWKKIVTGFFMVLYFVALFAFALFLFKFLPLFVAESASSHSAVVSDHYWLFNLIDGITKVVVFLVYILLISLMPDVKRVFAYHGAEHQAIWAYEKGKSLTVKHAQEEHPEHPRCGTSFIILVLITSVVIYTFLPAEEVFWIKLLERIAALPLIAGLSYEILRVSAKHEHRWWMRWITLPGL